MTATFYVGDAVSVMNRLPEKSVDLILTSPPFLALRSYLPADHPDKALEGGSQATPGEYIDWLIDVVEACDRVLAPHGSMCIELGDTYAGSGGAGGDYNAEGLREGQPKFRQQSPNLSWRLHPDGSVKTGTEVRASEPKNQAQTVPVNGGTGWPLAKSLSLIPELFRLTLVYGTNPLTGRTTERWRLRNVVRWVRPNPPVGALGDKFRPATSELMVFCKSAKRYFDLDAVREPYKAPDQLGKSMGYQKGADLTTNWLHGRNPSDVREDRGGAPPLDWWNIPPGGYEGAHYAVFPPELCIKPIKAMCPERVCRVCGEPSRRIVGEAEYVNARTGVEVDKASWIGGERNTQSAIGRDNGSLRVASTLGFSDCGHDDWRPGLVLDPFGGSGTTALVATGHGRDAILIDLDERNFELALDRVGPLVLSKGEVAA